MESYPIREYSAHDMASAGNLFDGMEEAVDTWPPEVRKEVLVHVMSLYAVCLKAAERDPSKSHPLIKYISRGLALYGINVIKN